MNFDPTLQPSEAYLFRRAVAITFIGAGLFLLICLLVNPMLAIILMAAGLVIGGAMILIKNKNVD